MSEPTPGEVNAAAESAVGHFLGLLGSDLSTGKFVLMVETIGPEGEQSMWMATGGQQKCWDTLGLLTYGLQYEQAAAIHDE